MDPLKHEKFLTILQPHAMENLPASQLAQSIFDDVEFDPDAYLGSAITGGQGF